MYEDSLFQIGEYSFGQQSGYTSALFVNCALKASRGVSVLTRNNVKLLHYQVRLVKSLVMAKPMSKPEGTLLPHSHRNRTELALHWQLAF